MILQVCVIHVIHTIAILHSSNLSHHIDNEALAEKIPRARVKTTKRVGSNLMSSTYAVVNDGQIPSPSGVNRGKAHFLFLNQLDQVFNYVQMLKMLNEPNA